MRVTSVFFVAALALCAAIMLATSPASTGTEYQTHLVPDAAGTNPGFSANGSSIKIDDMLVLEGKIEEEVDGAGFGRDDGRRALAG